MFAAMQHALRATCDMSTAERYRAAVERRDLPAVGELLSQDIVFHSPVTFHPFLGRETVTALLRAGASRCSRTSVSPTSCRWTARTR